MIEAPIGIQCTVFHNEQNSTMWSYVLLPLCSSLLNCCYMYIYKLRTHTTGFFCNTSCKYINVKLMPKKAQEIPR